MSAAMVSNLSRLLTKRSEFELRFAELNETLSNRCGLLINNGWQTCSPERKEA
jgi:hypothetical protein